jgi:hypothetical protein
MTEPGSHVPYPIGRSIGAIAMGAVLAMLGFLAGTAQGMSAAPSQAGPIVALAIIVVGIGLALLGLASIWMPRLRLASGRGTMISALLLLAAFVIDRIVSALDLMR